MSDSTRVETETETAPKSSEGKAPDGPTFVDLLRSLGSGRLLAILFLGFSSGLPYMLMASSLKIWLRREGIELSTIGYISWVMVPYSLNFLWAPLLDRFTPSALGRRRSWILIAQVGLLLSLAGLGFTEPTASLPLVVAFAIAVSFFSATQDIGIDAFRRESLRDEEQGIGASFIVYGYRVGMLVSTGLGLWLVDPDTLGLSFNQMWWLMAAFVLVGIVTVLLVKEPEAEFMPPQSFKDAVVEPFFEFLQRRGSILVLFFVLLFKIGDAFAGSMTSPYYVDIGFSDAEIAEAAKVVGFFSTMAGLFLGGVLIYRLGILRALFLFAFLQAFSTALFALLTVTGPQWWALATVVGVEDVSSGMGTAALVAFMSLLANKRYTATQYALLSSLASLGRTFFAGFAGKTAAALGYVNFFLFGSAMAIPGIILLVLLMRSFDLSASADGSAGRSGAAAAPESS
ncbi:MAG: AmpG family muropeptide MFS transporter [Acidobacteriota bacterium]